MSSRPLLTDQEITARYMDEWYSFHHTKNGTLRTQVEIEQKRKELLRAATAQIHQQKERSCLIL